MPAYQGTFVFKYTTGTMATTAKSAVARTVSVDVLQQMVEQQQLQQKKQQQQQMMLLMQLYLQQRQQRQQQLWHKRP
jgi:hypothetical protein